MEQCCDYGMSDFAWESAVRLSMGGKEEEGERKRRLDDGRLRDRKLPPKKMAGLGDMGGSGSSSSSHLSPGWQVNDLDLDLTGELAMNEALLSLPSLAVFKQEAPSPPGGAAAVSPPRRAWPIRQMATGIVGMGDHDGCQQSPPNGTMVPQNGNSDLQCTAMVPLGGYHLQGNENKGGGLLICSPNPLDGFLQSPLPSSRTEPSFKDDMRFQYVLAAATSMATKRHEETLTYLNQGQPYEIKLKKLGDLSQYKGKILKSIIRISFHERRLRFGERERMSAWRAMRPGERALEVDAPLSYGVTRVQQPRAPHLSNAALVLWDPTKDVGVYIKVNCISTEFTAKKHGGEKGVPFRILVETYFANSEEPMLHAAACQIKVFKLKGADRKHKQDREKLMRRSDHDKYQPGCEATVLTTLSTDAMLPPPSLLTASPQHSSDFCIDSDNEVMPNALSTKPAQQSGILSPINQSKTIYCEEEIKVVTSPCHSPGSILPDLPQQSGEDAEKYYGLSKEATPPETQAWLSTHRFGPQLNTFANFSGADLLRLSRDDIIQICGLADGIRLFNALHAKRMEPRLTLLVRAGSDNTNVYTALYLHEARARELKDKLRALLPANGERDMEYDTVIVSGPNNARVLITDDVLRYLVDNTTYKMDVEGNVILLTPTN